VVVAEMLGEPAGQVGDGDDLILDWGLDSMRVMGFVEELIADGVAVGIVDLAEQPTIAAWHALIADRRAVA
jgi:bifunctional isochorismate lyase/aryl carrier protein